MNDESIAKLSSWWCDIIRISCSGWRNTCLTMHPICIWPGYFKQINRYFYLTKLLLSQTQTSPHYQWLMMFTLFARSVVWRTLLKYLRLRWSVIWLVSKIITNEIIRITTVSTLLTSRSLVTFYFRCHRWPWVCQLFDGVYSITRLLVYVVVLVFVNRN